MERPEFAKLFDNFALSAFRLQTLPTYSVGSERQDYDSFLSGQPFPNREGNSWLSTITRNVSQGKQMANIHLLPSPLTPYLRYGIEWWYLYRAKAGESVRFLLPSAPAAVRQRAVDDFWLFDRRLVVVIKYDAAGVPLAFEKVDEPRMVEFYASLWDSLIAVSVPLEQLLSALRRGELA